MSKEANENLGKKKKKKKKKYKEYENLEIPAPIKRRRKSNFYRSSTKSETFDKVIIIFAVLIAFVMVTTKGCSKSVKNLSKFFTQKNGVEQRENSETEQHEVNTENGKKANTQ